ncbi:hypothetical protein N7453_004998 [Penicillium expansum]|nr:hypothetical protein N7453_004998 [Penicillium expansum]
MSLARTPTGLPRSNTLIDLQDMTTQTQPVRNGRRRLQQKDQTLTRRITRAVFRRDSNFKEIFKTISGDESLEKNYRKIAQRPNLGLVDQTFIYRATNAESLEFEKFDTCSACFERLRSSEEDR